MTTTYRGCTLTRTTTTTDVRRVAWGRTYRRIGYIWRVSGRLSSERHGQQWLTSAAECREWIREQDILSGPPCACASCARSAAYSPPAGWRT